MFKAKQFQKLLVIVFLVVHGELIQKIVINPLVQLLLKMTNVPVCLLVNVLTMPLLMMLQAHV